MKILINIFGIAIFFLGRLSMRKDKNKPLSRKYWIISNWEQFAAIALVDASLMIFVFQGGLKLNFEKLTFLPDAIQLAGDLATCWLVGLVFSYLVYEGYKWAILNRRTKPVSENEEEGK
jgi:hypothetical protein